MTIAETYRRNFLALLLIVVTAAFFMMMRRFLIPLLLAAIFAALVSPMYRGLTRWFRGRRRLAAIATLLIVFLVVVIPLTFFTGVLVSEAIQVSNAAMPWIQQQIANPDELLSRLETLPFSDKIVPHQGQVLEKAAEVVHTVGTFIVSRLSDVTRGTLTFLVDVVILFYAMFFFLTGGRRLLDSLMDPMPLSASERERIVGRFVTVTRAALASTVVIGLIQGLLGGLAFSIMGVPGAVFWGTVMAVSSMIPGVGPAIVWVPACAYLFAVGRTGVAIGLVIYFALIVGSVDNVLRPRLVGRDTQLPDLLVLLSTLGGLVMFGPVGFILGPVLAALFVTTWDIFTSFVQDSEESENGA